MSFQPQIIAIIVLIGLSAFFSASESALLSLNRFKVRYMVEKKRFGSHYIKKLKDNPERLLSTLLICNSFVSIAASAIATSVAIQVLKNNAIAISAGIMTFLILIFGEIIPKTMAIRNNEPFSLFSARIIWWLSIALNPVIKLIDYFLKALNTLIGTKKIPIITKEELKSIVRASEEVGALKEIEQKLVQRIFDFENITVSDVMTRKKSMVFVGADMLIKDVLQLPTAKMYSRFPVYQKDKENIVGILYLKDTLKFLRDGKQDVQIKEIMRKPLFVFEHKKMDSALRLFQVRKQHMAIVIDKHGNIVGLVTIENILEEIVGEIIDESDRLNPSIQQINKNEWLVKGSTELEAISSKTGIQMKDSDFVDLDTFIVASLGREPKVGDEIKHGTYLIIMEDVQGKKALKVRIVKV